MNAHLRTASSAIALALAVSPTLRAQDAGGETPLSSGPAAGTALTPVPCYATDGPHRGREFDAAAELGKAPSALLFIHELTRNTAPVLRGLDDLAAEFAILGFKSYTIMLSGDRTAGEAQLERVNGSLRLANPIVLSTDGAEGPGNYALNRKAALTLVFAKDGVATSSRVLTDTGPNDIPVIREAIEELTGKIPQDEAALQELIAARLPADSEALKQLAARQALALHRLRDEVTRLRQQPRGGGMQRQEPVQPAMRREGQPAQREGAQPNDNPPVKREGKPPEDPELQSLLRSYIRKTNDESRVDELFADIEVRAAESDALKREVVEMFKLMLSIDYGNEHAQELAAEFLKSHGPAKSEE